MYLSKVLTLVLHWLQELINENATPCCWCADQQRKHYLFLDEQKNFEKMQYIFMIKISKTLSRSNILGQQWPFQQTKANIIRHSGRKLKALSFRLDKDVHINNYSIYFFKYLQQHSGKRRNKRHTLLMKKINSLFANDMIRYLYNPEGSVREKNHRNNKQQNSRLKNQHIKFCCISLRK